VSFDPKPFSEYVSTVEKTLATGHASEGSHYPTLKALLESVGEGVVATSLPRGIECGAPDFVITKGALTVGCIEAKDIGKSLDEAEKSEQLSRYRDSLSNLILTDYLEFRWYRDGKRELEAKLGTVDGPGKIKREKTGIEEVAKLLIEFFRFEAPGVGTPKELAVRMARLAHRIREGAEEALDKGIASDLLSGLHKAFQATLIPSLEIKVFADMYAQTIAYGLFAARCETDDASKFTLKDATDLIPQTNPFLKDLFYQITGPDLNDEPYKWAVDELVQVLKKADMTEIVRGLSKGTGKDDPVVYFYEDFLREYDKKISEMRGVYYTPMPVVSYIVSSISYLLKNRFNRPQGLADENTYILDPATGTGTFLYAVINEIYESMSKQGQMGKWDGYVAKHLLPRIFGFELLMAPYVIAHLKLGLQLRNTGYTFQSKERLGVYLTNTLEQAVKSSEMLMAQYIVKEANTAAEIKKEKPIMVVLGNPPYSVSSANKGEHIEKLMERYKAAVRNERNIQPLSDDYIKFIRFAHDRIEGTGYGIIGMITNHTYLSGLIHRCMREELAKSFSSIYILDLHGSSLIGEKTPSGGKDENVFDIMQGVAIALFIKEPGATGLAKVYHADVWGTRKDKYNLLLETDVTSTAWAELQVQAPNYFFFPQKVEFQHEYQKAWSIEDIFIEKATGFVTGNDDYLIAFDRERIAEVINNLVNKEVSDKEVEERFGIRDVSGWPVSQRRKGLILEGLDENKLRLVSYRPFDSRFCYYHGFLQRAREELMTHLLQGNIALVSTRMIKGEIPNHFFVSNNPVEKIFLSPKTSNNAFVFPLYLYPAEGEMQFEEGHRRPNLNPEFIKAVLGKLGLKFVPDGKGDLKETFGPEDIFNYAYAIFHSPTYRSRYAEFLKIDFPRLPLASDLTLFRALCEKGAELMSWHLLTNPSLQIMRSQIKYDIKGSNAVEKVRYDDNLHRVYINKTQYFEGIAPDVWDFHIGGYQVCGKWLKVRKGRKLNYDDQSHYQDIAVAIKETIRIMAEIDQVIPEWPIE